MRVWRVPYPKFGAGPGLERVAEIAARLGLTLSGFGAYGAVIVGSNGKGSTAAMTEALLRQNGARVGLFTSPHLFALNERFRVDGEDIADDELSHHWARVAEAIERAGVAAQMGGFEFLFLIAADWFAARGCAHTILEAGIGGRLDPVRLIEARRLALTSLDFEHTDLLGDTLADISRDKLDAAPPGARVYVGASCVSERAAIEAHCTGKVTVAWPEAYEAALPLRGTHQSENAGLAIALARDIAGPSLDRDAIVRGFASVHWPGRLETINDDPLIVIDVGHTPAAIEVALEGFEGMRGARAGILVCGASMDKNVEAIVSAIAPSFGTIICAAARHKGAPAGVVAAYAAKANTQAEVMVADDVAEARDLALDRVQTGAAIYVAGGLFLAAEFKALHLGRDPSSLVFF